MARIDKHFIFCEKQKREAHPTFPPHPNLSSVKGGEGGAVLILSDLCSHLPFFLLFPLLLPPCHVCL